MFRMRKSDLKAKYGNGLSYEYDIKPKKKNRKNGGKDSKMSKSTNQAETKSAKKYAKTRGEHYKDIVITILVTAIIAFICGAVFQSKQHNAINTAIKAVTPSAHAEASK